MTLTEARKVLERYRNWRGNNWPDEGSIPHPDEVDEAIDIAISVLPDHVSRPTARERLEEIREKIRVAKGFDPFEYKNRDRDLVAWRYCAYYQLRKEGYTFGQIGRASGYDHATVIHAYQTLRDYLETKDWITTTIWNEYLKIVQ